MVGPIVGTVPEYDLRPRDVPWILGTQLTMQVGPLARAREGDRVLMIESEAFARRKPYHQQKLSLVFAAMRAFRDRIEEEGYDIEYKQADSFRSGLDSFFAANPDTRLVVMRSPSYRSGERLQEVVEEVGGSLRVVDNELFVSTRQAFDEWANGSSGGFNHEQFYRWMRRETGVLLTEDGAPVGGEWNYDDENREFPPEGWESPPRPDHDHGERTERTRQWVRDTFDTWGNDGAAVDSPGESERNRETLSDWTEADGTSSADEPETDGFVWPVTREQARNHLQHVVEQRLPEFGPYQDAMRSDDWAMAHSLLGAAINLGLLHPIEVIEAAEAAYERDSAPLSSVEGFIRQVLGWREFMRHVYRHTMPELAEANRLDATEALPEFYWTGDTRMNCLAETVEDVYDRGYSHHIQRLMVLANFATLWGVDPAELNEWFHATYVDAYHWVTTPNVIEMGQYAHGAFATKPYVSSANYIDRMSDYCGDCAYYKTTATGEDACPFNALYWDFLARNEDDLRSNHRMGLMYGHVDDKRESGELAEIRERVENLREMAENGDL